MSENIQSPDSQESLPVEAAVEGGELPPNMRWVKGPDGTQELEADLETEEQPN